MFDIVDRDFNRWSKAQEDLEHDLELWDSIKEEAEKIIEMVKEQDCKKIRESIEEIKFNLNILEDNNEI